MSRAYNFSAGPATLPEEVLKEAQGELLDFAGSGMSIMESSHRGKEYSAIHEEAIANVTELMGLDDDHAVLFMQGGATGQFGLIAMNFLTEGKTADYTNSGSWAKKAIAEAKIIGNVNVIADTTEASPARMPLPGELNITPDAAYLHLTSNETIAGTQWKAFPETDVPIVADMSSDILSRPLDFNAFSLIYAGAQKNLGPAGVTLVIIRKDLAEQVNEKVPSIFRYKTMVDKNSLSNTPPCFPIYIVALVTRWLKNNGGVAAMHEQNQAKAAKLYDLIDNSGFYKGTADPAHRSDMNVTFRAANEELEPTFIAEAVAAGLKGLKGHRSVGGMRASIYNAFPAEGVDVLIDFMKDFESKNG